MKESERVNAYQDTIKRFVPMKTLVHGKSAEKVDPAAGAMENDVSQIIQRAKSLRARLHSLQAGRDRRDAELRELRESLAKERGRLHWPEFVFGMICAVVIRFVMRHG